jgi:hypothetical protein
VGAGEHRSDGPAGAANNQALPWSKSRDAERELAAAGVKQTPRVVLADAGYCHHDQMDRIAGRGTTVLIPPDSGRREGNRPGWDSGLIGATLPAAGGLTPP